MSAHLAVRVELPAGGWSDATGEELADVLRELADYLAGQADQPPAVVWDKRGRLLARCDVELAE